MLRETDGQWVVGLLLGVGLRLGKKKKNKRGLGKFNQHLSNLDRPHFRRRSFDWRAYYSSNTTDPFRNGAVYVHDRLLAGLDIKNGLHRIFNATNLDSKSACVGTKKNKATSKLDFNLKKPAILT